MNEKDKEQYLQEYQKAKEKGVPFFPDALFKDAVVSLIIFLALVGLAFFLGAPLEERADPSDTTYTPRPEWYFLFLFQLLKYFPGALEVIGVFVIPTIAILLLFALPLLDRKPGRHFLRRPVVTGVTAILVLGAVGLTLQALFEAPPPAETAEGDQAAALYTEDCAPCHGTSIDVPAGTNLHEIIAQGQHEEGMPAWGADLTANEIDALAGFILSPNGSHIFADECGQCHELSELVAGNPLELTQALDQGSNYPPHADLEIPEWRETLTAAERTSLLNFLAAPDGQRLFVVNCASCHGRAVAFSGEESQLRETILQGGLHLQMPPWRERLASAEINTLAAYVVDPSARLSGAEGLFELYCSDCHGNRVPTAETLDAAREIIAIGGAHETMPVWGEVLTPQQLEALVAYTLETTSGAPAQVGQELFAQYCSVCHGDFGEGGPNPARTNDVIAPISSAEYLKTRDDATLRSVIAQGQPNFGMSPFGTAFGGPLDDEQIDAIVAFIRNWEANPPVEFPPDVVQAPIAATGKEVFASVCARCHGGQGEGGIGPALNSPEFQAGYEDQEIFDIINSGHDATAMIGWGEIITSEQIDQLVDFIRSLDLAAAPPTPGVVSFQNDVVPILEAKCAACHGTLGGWDASSYESVIESGDNGPAVIPGDADGSLLSHKLLGTQTQGAIMPPGGKLPDDEIKIILDWIDAGAPNN
jgi:mono/diheme cytochrome c family protein